MEAVRIPVTVGVDRRLVIDLPDSTPLGPADVVIVPRPNRADMAGAARERTRAKLLAADFLVTDLAVPRGIAPLTEEEIAQLGQLPPNDPGSEVLIHEDRGSY